MSAGRGSEARYRVVCCCVGDLDVDDWVLVVPNAEEAKELTPYTEDRIKEIEDKTLAPGISVHAKKFNRVKNFRDLACFNNVLKPGLLYRSAAPSVADKNDAFYLVNGLDLMTIIDLREEYESAEDENAGNLGMFKPVAPRAAHSEKSRKLVRVPLAPRKAYVKTVMRKATWRQRWQLIKHGLLGKFSDRHHEEARRVGMRVIDDDGLLGMNLMMLRMSGPAICEFLRVCSNPANHPLLFHCSHGKDRTGLATALLLACAGVDEDDIIVDYVASKSLGGTELCARDVERKSKGALTTDVWASAHPGVMRSTLQFVRDAYGGVPAYLRSIGFDDESQQRLREALCRTDPSDETC